MKKFILIAVLTGIGSVLSFGAPCPTGPVVLTSMPTTCTIGSWTLGGFGVDPNSGSYGYPTAPAAGDFNIDIDLMSAVPGYGLGFVMTLSNSLQGVNFFQGNSSGVNQTANFIATYNILSGPAIQGSQLQIVSGTVVPTSNNGVITLQELLSNASLPGNPPFSNSTAIVFGAGQFGNSGWLPGLSGNAVTEIAVANRYTISAGGDGGAYAYGIRNTFYSGVPEGPVPEPAQAILLGSGLIVAAFMRKKSSGSKSKD